MSVLYVERATTSPSTKVTVMQISTDGARAPRKSRLAAEPCRYTRSPTRP